MKKVDGDFFVVLSILCSSVRIPRAHTLKLTLQNTNSTPITTATIPYIKGTSKIIAQILQPYNVCVAHKPITTLQQGPLVFQLTYCQVSLS